MKMISDVHYTDEEAALSSKLCEAINADKELAAFFKQRLGSILQGFAEGIVVAAITKDRQKAKEVTEHTGEAVKALIMHMYVKVRIKEKESSPSLN